MLTGTERSQQDSGHPQHLSVLTGLCVHRVYPPGWLSGHRDVWGLGFLSSPRDLLLHPMLGTVSPKTKPCYLGKPSLLASRASHQSLCLFVAWSPTSLFTAWFSPHLFTECSPFPVLVCQLFKLATPQSLSPAPWGEAQPWRSPAAGHGL